MRRDTRLAAYGTYGFTLHWLKKIDIMPPKSKPDPPAPHPYSDLVPVGSRSITLARGRATWTIDPRYPKSLIPGYRRKQVCKRGIISVVVIAYAVHQVHIYIRRLA